MRPTTPGAAGAELDQGPGGDSAAALAIRGLRFRYSSDGGSALVIDIPSLTLARGAQMLLTGGSGSGKSTLLQLIAGLLDPLEGSVEVAGRVMHGMRGAQRDLYRGRTVGFIFQTFNLLHGFTACENIMAALMFSEIPAREHRARSLRLLEHLGIDRPDATPDELSVGQQQRVAVARAVACDPVLVLADEPTASLDPENAGAAMELIRTMCSDKGAALLCVSHDPAMRERFPLKASLSELARGRTC